MDFDPEALPVPDLGLRCIGCGYRLYGLPSHRCPECGRDFTLDEHIPRGDFPTVIIDGREVRMTADVCEILRRTRILFMAGRGAGENIFGLNQTNNPFGKLAVERARYFEAIHWLRHFAATGELPPERPIDGDEWTCKHCSESNPPTFEVCWNCGSQ